MDNRFNNFNLTDEEINHIIKQFESIIRKKSLIHGIYNEDCVQEIKIQIYKTLSKNRKNKKI